MEEATAADPLEEFLEAVRQGNDAGVQEGISAGFVNTPDEQGWTAMDWASWTRDWNWNPKIVKMLLAGGALINSSNRGSWTAIHRAVNGEDKQLVEMLLAAGASVLSRDNQGWTALDRVSLNGISSLEILMTLHSALDKVRAFFMAVECGDVAAVQRGIDSGLVNETGDGPGGQDGWSAMHWAVHAGHLQILELLLSAGASPEAKDKCGQTPLHYAVIMQNSEQVFLLLERGACSEVKTTTCGQTPLVLAVRMQNAALVTILLGAGCPNTAVCWTPLCHAVDKGNVKILQMLLDAGASYQVEMAGGRTPLHAAATNGDHVILKMLLNTGARIDAADWTGATPLHFSVKGADPMNTAKMLLAAGADPRLKNQAGRTARDIAYNEWNEELATMIEGAEEDILLPKFSRCGRRSVTHLR